MIYHLQIFTRVEHLVFSFTLLKNIRLHLTSYIVTHVTNIFGNTQSLNCLLIRVSVKLLYFQIDGVDENPILKG